MTLQVDQIRTNVKNLKRAAVEGLGEWDWSNDDAITFTSDTVGFVRYKIPSQFGLGPATLYHVAGFSYGIGIGESPRIVWRFLGSTGLVSKVTTLEAPEYIDRGLQYAKVYANENGMALTYESGILFLDTEGSIRWQRNDIKLNWHFHKLDEHGITFIDSEGNEIEYSIVDGQPMDK
jgi:hypothetical protein